MSSVTLNMNDPKDEKISSNPKRIYLFVCTLPGCNDICMSRDKLLDHLEGHKVFETKVIDFENDHEEQLAEFVKMIDNDGETLNTDKKQRLKTIDNSKKSQCIFNNCKTTFFDRKEAIDHLRKRHLTTLDTSKNNLLKVSTKNDDVIVDHPNFDSEHSVMDVMDHLEIEMLGGSDNECVDQTWKPSDAPEDELGEDLSKNKIVKPKLLPKKRKKNEIVKPESSLLKKRKKKEVVKSESSSPKKRTKKEVVDPGSSLPKKKRIKHLYLRLSDEANNKHPFQCIRCDKCFSSPSKVVKHDINVHNHQRSYCQFEGCSASYANPRDLRDHESIVHKKDAVMSRCLWPGCEFASYHRRTILRHSRVHTDERPYRCEWSDCKKAFKTSSALGLHTASHRNERQHRCSWPGCSYSCNVAASLKKHADLHERKQQKEESAVAAAVVVVDSDHKIEEKPDSM